MTTRPGGLRLPSAPVADQRFLEALRKSGVVPPKVLSSVERTIAHGDVSAVDAVIDSGALSEQDLAKVMAEALGYPLLDLQANPPCDDGAALIGKSTAEHYALVPAQMKSDALLVAMANPFDREALGSIESATGSTMQPAVAPRSQIFEAIDRLYRRDSSLSELLADVSPSGSASPSRDRDPVARLDPSDVQAVTKDTEEAPVIKMVNLILFEAFSSRASDVHIEPGPNLVVVRFRVDGILEEHLQMPKWVQSAIVARIKVMAKLDITERRVPQDGHLAVRVRDETIDVRVSSMPTTYGEKIVMRLLDPSSGPRRLADIGLSAEDLATLRSVIRRPEGIILVTGPTGSGKTTTLYAIIQELFSSELNIVTIENPVEYELKGVSQIPVNEKQGLTFSEVLRSVLRQDPDVILIGEIRDRETAEIAFQAAQTGHLVLSTLHTNDATASVTRLLELGVEPQVMGVSLLAVIAQRLVRKVCAACNEPVEATAEERRALALPLDKRLRHGRGCPACRETGLVGRTGIYEVLRVSKALSQLIEQKAPESTLRAVAEDHGMTSLVEDARQKILDGVTTPAEVLRVVEVDSHGPTCPACSAGIEANFTVCPFCRNPLRLTCGGCGAVMKKKWTTCPFCSTDVAPLPVSARPLPDPVQPMNDLGGFEVPKILAVDDDPDVLELVRLTLARSQPPLHVEVATSGAEALAKAKASRPHLVVLDLMMPGIDGYEVCKHLRADLATALIPIVMLTACSDVESKRLGFLSGTDDYVVKPFERSELLARVHRLLARMYGWGGKSAAPAPRDPNRLDA